MEETTTQEVASEVSQEAASPETPTTSEAPSFTIPDAYKENAWTEKVSSNDDLWKMTANLQEMIGKRPAGIPSENASDAEWEKFNKALGVPDEANYEFNELKDLPEGLDLESYDKTARDLFHKAGLTTKQAKVLRDAYIQSELGKAQESSAALDDKFDAIVKENFGDDYDKYEQATVDAFDRYSPQNLKGALAQIQDKPEALAAIVATVKGLQGEIAAVQQEYGKEGNLATGDQTSSATPADVLKELTSLRISKEARDFTHPDHQSTLDKINKLQEQYARVNK